MNNKMNRKISFLRRLLGNAAISTLCLASAAHALDINVVTLTKLSETRVDRTNYDYVFSVTVKMVREQ